jgi:ABC-type uncharacterized transport system permease subunit
MPSSILSKLAAFASTCIRTIAAIALTAVIAVFLIKAIGGNVGLALSSLWDGAFGNAYKLGNTFVAATPLLLTGLGVSIAFRSRMWNIGGEGQFLVGCLASSAVAVNCPLTAHLPELSLLLVMLIVSGFAGAGWAAIAAVLKTGRDVPEVISTIMLNFVAIYLLSYLVTGPMERPDHAQPATAMLENNATLPLLSQMFPSVLAPSPLHFGFVIALVMIAVVYVLLNQTATGFVMKLVGANPDAARLAGVSVNRTFIVAMIWSGALCGLAGGIELSGRVGFIPLGYSPGYGYEAIAVALLGRLSPVGVFFTAVFIGALTVGCNNMERTAGIAHEMGLMIQAVALLALLSTQWSGWSAFSIRRRQALGAGR